MKKNNICKIHQSGQGLAPHNKRKTAEWKPQNSIKCCKDNELEFEQWKYAEA